MLLQTKIISYTTQQCRPFLRGGGDCSTKVGALCSHFVDMGALVRTQVENGFSKKFDFQGQTFDVYDQAIFTLNDLGLHDEEGNKKIQAT